MTDCSLTNDHNDVPIVAKIKFPTNVDVLSVLCEGDIIRVILPHLFEKKMC